MSSAVGAIIEGVEREIEHSRNVSDIFLRALCLFETHYRRHSTLLEMFPDLGDEAVSDVELAELKKLLVHFVEELPCHSSSPAAIWLLTISHDPNLKEFFVKQLRRFLGWRDPIPVFHLLLGLEDLQEKVFYSADGQFIGSRSAHDTDTNFSVAERYLKTCVSR